MLRGSRRGTAGAKPYTMKVVRTVLNGGDEETGLCRPRLVATQPSLLWWLAVAGIIEVTSSNTLRNKSRCPWRYRESGRNVSNTAIRRTLSLLHPCGRVTVD